MSIRRMFARGNRPASSCLFLAAALLSLPVCGCNKANNPQANSATSSTSATASAAKTTRVSPEESARWLASGVPPLAEEIATSPVKLSEPKLEQNEFGQEILTINYERPAVVRTMAAEVKLVLLPTLGGRADVYVQPGILIQPQNTGQISSITGGLLDYRGHLRSGMRAYLEMHIATIGRPAPKAERVSDVIWIGSDDQLAAAMQHAAASEHSSEASIPEPALKSVPAGKIAQGTPLWMRCGDRWSRGHALEDATGDQVRLLIYLVRRDKPYLPWVANLPRSELRIEEPALAELQRDANAFQDLADADQLKLSRHGVPNKLEPIDAANLPVDTPVLDFWNGMLDPCRTTGPVKDDAVPIQRVGLDNAQMVKPVKGLFNDPFGK